MEICDRSVLNQREISDYPENVIEIIRKVTGKMETLPVGTFKYKVFKYPSDIDLFEQLSECCTFNESKLKAASIIQYIGKTIAESNHTDMIFSDFKAGYDSRFKVYTGIINKEISDYNPVLIRRDIANLHESQLLTDIEYNCLCKLVKDSPNIDDIIKLNEALREYWLIRWTLCDLLRGYKLLRGNYKLYLDTALTQGSIVKLDAIAKLDIGENSRYIEVSNFFLIIQRDKTGKQKILSEELGDYGQSLLHDVYKYYNTNKLKSIKRLWMYLAFKNAVCDLNIFTPLFNSDIAIYSQIMGDIDTAIILLKSNFTYDTMYLQNTINKRLSQLNGVCTKTPIGQITTDQLTEIRNCLQDIINTMTSKWLSDHKIDIIKLAQSY